MARTAVILAAGFGSRLQGIWNGQPKGLIPVDGIRLIDRSLSCLKLSGIERVIIGTGHMSEVYNDMRSRYSFLETVHSHDFASTSSFATLMKMKNVLDEDILLLESDLLYHKSALEFLQQSPEGDIVLSSDITNMGDEVFLEVNEDNHLIGLSKDPKQLGKIHSILVGINKLSKTYLRDLFAHGEEILSKNAKIDYEKAFVELGNHRPIRVRTLTGLAWTEIDTPEHYQYALKSVLPRLN